MTETEQTPPSPAAVTALQPAPTKSLSREPEGKFQKLSFRDVRLALDLHAKGKSSPEIAHILGKHQSSILRAIKAFADDTTDLAVRRAKSHALDRAARLQSWTQTRDRIGLEAAKHLDNIAGLVDKSGPVNNLQVVIGLPGQAVGSDPLGGQDIVATVINSGQASTGDGKL